MKRLNYILVVLTSVIILGCEMFGYDLQETIDYEPETRDASGFDMTVWQWLAQDPADSNFFLMKDAIKRAYELDEAGDTVWYADELYNNPDTTFTFILLSNDAFILSLKDLQNIKGKTTGFITDIDASQVNVIVNNYKNTGELSLDGIDDVHINWLIKYHSLPDVYIKQEDISPRDTEFVFQTMIEGEGGRMVFQRDDAFQLKVNNSDIFDGKVSGDIRWQNYRFKNGMAHLTNKYFAPVAKDDVVNQVP